MYNCKDNGGPNAISVQHITLQKAQKEDSDVMLNVADGIRVELVSWPDLDIQ